MSALRRSGWVLAAISLTTALLAASAARVRTDNTPAAWLPERAPEREVYLAFRERFGADTFLLVALRLAPPGEAPPADWAPRLLALAQRLEQAAGVVEVRAPVAAGSLAERARADLPATLAALDAAAAGASGSAAAELERVRAEAHATLPALLLEPDDPRALRSARAAQQAALRALVPLAPAAAADLGDGRWVDDAADLPRAAQEALYAWALARGAETRAARTPALLADLPRVDALMARLAAAAPDLYGGGPDLFLATRLAAAPPGAARDARLREHLDRAAAVAPAALLPRVVRAATLAPTLAATPAGAPLEAVLAASRRAWEAFAQPLGEVLAAPVDLRAPARQALADAVARERAAALLADPAGAGVLPPPDAVVPRRTSPAVHLVASPAGQVLLSPDGRWAGLLVLPQADLGPAERAACVAAIEGALADSAQAGDAGGWADAHLVGPEALTHDLDVASRRSFGGLFPLVAALLGAVLWLALRDLRLVAGVLLTAGAAAIWTVGGVALAGRTLNMILVVLPAIVAVLTTAYALHLVTRFQGLEGEEEGDRVAAWSRAIRETVRPCALTAATTAVGFASLLVSEIPPVRDLGLFAGLGALAAFVLSFTLLPCLLVRSGAVRPAGAAARGRGLWTAARADAVARFATRRGAWILLAAALVGALALEGTRRLEVESHVLRFFPAEHRLPQGYAAVEPGWLGLTPLELFLEGPAAEVRREETLEALDRFAEAAAHAGPGAASGRAQVISPLRDPRLADLSLAARAALLRAQVAAGAREGGAYLQQTSAGGLALRVTVTCATGSSDAFHRLVETLRRDVPAELSTGGLRLHLTGAVPLLVRVQVLLVETQLSSFTLALGVVTLLLGAVYRSIGLLLVSLLPNVLPVLVTLGGMGWLGVPLNTATVTVAGIALGLVVDDTIHLLHHVHHRLGGGASRADAVADALRVVGRPVATTTCAVAIGFGAFLTSDFLPTRAFGGLIALTCLTALVCDLVALPALLLLNGRSRS